jgi:glycosyltransferase involved in cell wall biosynthesis
MRIGLDAWGLSGGLVYTGVGQYVRHLIGHLSSLGHDATVIAYGAPREPRPDWLPESAEWRAPGQIVNGRGQALISRMFTLRKHLDRDAIDVFHAPGVHTRASLPLVASVSTGLVATVHDLIPLTYYGNQLPARSRWYYRWNLRRALAADAVITVSETSRRELSSHAPNAASRVTVVPNGLQFAPNHDKAALDRLGIRPPYILFAGSYEPRKNIRAALDAYARLASQGTRYRLVGIVEATSGYAPAVREHLAALGLADSVHLVHSLPDSELRAVYTHAEVLCFPSLAEGFGFPPLQAAACRVPVVASDLPATRESLGDYAVYVDPTSAEEFAQALRAAIEDGDLRERLTEGAHRRSTRYSWEDSACAHWNVYQAVAAR